MKSLSVALFASLFALAGCTHSSAQETDVLDEVEDATAEASEALTPAGGDQCPTVTQAALQEVVDLVESAKDRAELTVAHHQGEVHTYMADDTYANIEAARVALVSTIDWLNGPASDNNPAATNYVEGGSVFLSAMLNQQQAIDISRVRAALAAIYLGDVDAYLAFEDLALASERLNDLATRGGRCYIAAYGVPGGN